jgi:magnesium-transporting ATPase (P-type)
MDTIYGLTESEAQARRKQGLGNDTASGPSRSYWDIARANLFTLFNNILFILGVALVSLGRYSDALTSVGLGLINALIAGMAMLLAALAAEGSSTIHNVGQIERGYERIDERLRALGADIQRAEG